MLYIKEKIGEKYLIPLIGVWDKVEDIDFNSLPKQFVLKVNWGSGQNIIVKDKSKLNIEETKNKLNGWLKPFSNHYYYSYEWQYKDIEPKIICEKNILNKWTVIYLTTKYFVLMEIVIIFKLISTDIQIIQDVFII
ncbi:ATP-grasp fold amidoligase family protein [Brachyspira aalborgi]|uniref:ATP-grasp fold amidoligase family protein n=1 Tax=Brachyspira aalborgi TaxID=29522 RepID=UPI0030CF98B1